MAKTVDIEKKRQKEIETVTKMIEIYCSSLHHSKELCPDCKSLLEYATLRSSRCPFMAEKRFCAQCKIHCYGTEEQKAIKEVMRYAGPRMIFHYPKEAILHVYYTILDKISKKVGNF